jgi:hypothetical protein
MGFEFRIRTNGPWPPASCDELLLRLGDPSLDVRSVAPRAGGYARTTYEVRLASRATEAMPDAHVQIESDGFYLCENGSPPPGLMEQLVRCALRSGAVTIEEL